MTKDEKILDVKVNFDVTLQQALYLAENVYLKDGNCHYICTTNPEFIMDAQKDPDFKKIINESDLSLPDGIGVILAHEYINAVSMLNKKSPLFIFGAIVTGLKTGMRALFDASLAKQRVDGVSLVDKLCEMSAKNNYSVFLLGGRQKDTLGNPIHGLTDLSSIAAANLRKRYPTINIIGNSSQFSREEHDDILTRAYIKECMQKNNIKRLDILLVAYNHNYQEKWILRNATNIPANLSVGVGATIDYLAGYKKTSPTLITKVNLEWLFKLLTQPWRYKRIFNAFPQFPLKVFVKSIK